MFMYQAKISTRGKTIPNALQSIEHPSLPGGSILSERKEGSDRPETNEDDDDAPMLVLRLTHSLTHST